MPVLSEMSGPIIESVLFSVVDLKDVVIVEDEGVLVAVDVALKPFTHKVPNMLLKISANFRNQT